jgi:hypothetical protein
MGDTPAERYVNAAVQQEVMWVAGRTEGAGERHRGLLVAAMKLGSLKLSEWIPDNVRSAIDLFAVLLPAARENGYIRKYGEADAVRTIQDGISYATPRPPPEKWGNQCQPLAWRARGGYLKVAVRA